MFEINSKMPNSVLVRAKSGNTVATVQAKYSEFVDDGPLGIFCVTELPVEYWRYPRILGTNSPNLKADPLPVVTLPRGENGAEIGEIVGVMQTVTNPISQQPYLVTWRDVDGDWVRESFHSPTSLLMCVRHAFVARNYGCCTAIFNPSRGLLAGKGVYFGAEVARGMQDMYRWDDPEDHPAADHYAGDAMRVAVSIAEQWRDVFRRDDEDQARRRRRSPKR